MKIMNGEWCVFVLFCLQPPAVCHSTLKTCTSDFSQSPQAVTMCNIAWLVNRSFLPSFNHVLHTWYLGPHASLHAPGGTFIPHGNPGPRAPTLKPPIRHPDPLNCPTFKPYLSMLFSKNFRLITECPVLVSKSARLVSVSSLPTRMIPAATASLIAW